MPESHYLQDLLTILIAAVISVSLFQKMRLGAVMGYLMAGIAIGPSGLGLINQLEGVRSLAEMGVVFLLFTIGLELTVARLRMMGAATYALGILQIGVTGLAVAGVVLAFGYDGVAAVIVGGGLALSSTAIVLPLLAQLGKMTAPVGQMALAILLLQDLAVGPLLVLVEVLSDPGGAEGLGSALGMAALQAVLAVGVIVLFGRLFLRPLFRVVAETNSPELFAGTALLVALGTSWLTEHAGLSMAFGAFLAGLMLAETEFRHQVMADIQPFRGLLLGLFFMTVGMGIDLAHAFDQWLVVLLLAVAILVGKGVLLLGLAMAFRTPFWRAVRLAASLAQGGEFAFVLFGMAMAAGVLDSLLGQRLTAAVALTMAVTPVLLLGGRRVISWLEHHGLDALDAAHGQHFDLSGHVIVVGYGDIGEIVARMLKVHEVPYLVLDLSPRRVKEARAEGEPVYFGDASLEEVLHGVHAGHARAIVVTTQAPGVAEGVLAVQRHAFPGVRILARGGSERAVSTLRRAGVTVVAQEHTETGLKLVGAVLDLEQGDSLAG